MELSESFDTFKDQIIEKITHKRNLFHLLSNISDS